MEKEEENNIKESSKPEEDSQSTQINHIKISPEDIEQYLKKLGIGSQHLSETKSSLTGKRLEGQRRRNKRKYIRKRLREGKPYIPMAVRQLGKEEAASRGYEDWSDTPTGRVSDLELIRSMIEDIIGTAVDIEGAGVDSKNIKISPEVMERQKRALSSALGIKRDGLDVFINKLIMEKEREIDERERVDRERESLMPKIEQAIKDIKEKEDKERSQQNAVRQVKNENGDKNPGDVYQTESNSGFNREQLAKDINQEVIENAERETDINRGSQTHDLDNTNSDSGDSSVNFIDIPGDDPLKMISLNDERKRVALCFVYGLIDEKDWGTKKAEKLFYNVLKTGMK